VERIVVTHLRNPVEGKASGMSLEVATGDRRESSIWLRVYDVSNQKRQVI